MDDCGCFFLPLICGCSQQVEPKNDETTRVCPRCHNTSVYSAKSKNMFEVCCVPIFPLSSKTVWSCNICSWMVERGPGWEPMVPQPGYQHPGAPVMGPPQGSYPGPQGYFVQQPQQAYGPPGQSYPGQTYGQSPQSYPQQYPPQQYGHH